MKDSEHVLWRMKLHSFVKILTHLWHRFMEFGQHQQDVSYYSDMTKVQPKSHWNVLVENYGQIYYKTQEITKNHRRATLVS